MLLLFNFTSIFIRDKNPLYGMHMLLIQVHVANLLVYEPYVGAVSLPISYSRDQPIMPTKKVLSIMVIQDNFYGKLHQKINIIIVIEQSLLKVIDYNFHGFFMYYIMNTYVVQQTSILFC